MYQIRRSGLRFRGLEDICWNVNRTGLLISVGQRSRWVQLSVERLDQTVEKSLPF